MRGMFLSCCATEAEDSILAGEADHIEFLIRMVHAAGLHLGGYFGGLAFGVETAVEGSQFLD